MSRSATSQQLLLHEGPAMWRAVQRAAGVELPLRHEPTIGRRIVGVVDQLLVRSETTLEMVDHKGARGEATPTDLAADFLRQCVELRQRRDAGSIHTFVGERDGHALRPARVVMGRANVRHGRPMDLDERTVKIEFGHHVSTGPRTLLQPLPLASPLPG